jgi:hypothetical protein
MKDSLIDKMLRLIAIIIDTCFIGYVQIAMKNVYYLFIELRGEHNMSTKEMEEI